MIIIYLLLSFVDEFLFIMSLEVERHDTTADKLMVI